MLALAAVLLSGVVSPVALAEDGNDSEGLADALQPLNDGNKPARTIMIYSDGAASEEKNPVMTAMLKEYMATKFDCRDFRIIVMTGGSLICHDCSRENTKRNASLKLSFPSRKMDIIANLHRIGCGTNAFMKGRRSPSSAGLLRNASRHAYVNDIDLSSFF